MSRQIVLDTETTGLDPLQGHRIIEIGCIELINRRVTDNHYHQYINPEREIDAEAREVHGISNDMLRDKPVFADITDDLIAYLDGAELIIHNAPFDIGFLNHEFALLNRGIAKLDKSCSVIDTLQMARKLHPGQRNSLDALCKRYNVDNSGRKLHGALIDADLLASVYMAMTSGQNSLFAQVTQKKTSREHSTSAELQEQSSELVSAQHLKIQYANAEELEAHQAYLKEVMKTEEEAAW